ncbi:EC1118_1O4_5468p [Saccharomyces cerevisiae EC1118]|uniref:EC1118_1O4_5468p n=1 Tax=Saccharomyces cerevisiae (strain Lalvin EC1118 / Prise de mousse) TaxID=643680 RepID=C8ZH59_YEAS8|nr:EC1118_1O4_5468p [Saccharomyces cerevisiae EC1118]
MQMLIPQRLLLILNPILMMKRKKRKKRRERETMMKIPRILKKLRRKRRTRRKRRKRRKRRRRKRRKRRRKRSPRKRRKRRNKDAFYILIISDPSRSLLFGFRKFSIIIQCLTYFSFHILFHNL